MSEHLSPNSIQSEEESKIKTALVNHHKQLQKEGGRIDIAKLVADYQNKFNVPKVLLLQWLGINSQKSLFEKNKMNANLSQSFISQDSEMTKSDPSTCSIRVVGEGVFNSTKSINCKLLSSVDKGSSGNSRSPSKFSKFVKQKSTVNNLNNMDLRDCEGLDLDMESNSDSSLEREQRTGQDSSITPAPVQQLEVKERKGKLIKSNFIVQKKDMIGSKLNLKSPTELKEIAEDTPEAKESESETQNITQTDSENLQGKSQRKIQREFSNPNENVRIRIRKNSLPILARSASNPQDLSRTFKSNLNRAEEPISNSSHRAFDPSNTNYQKYNPKMDLNGQKKLFAKVSRNARELAASNSNHLRSTPKHIFTQRTDSTVSVKDLISRENLMQRLSESSSAMFPALSGRGRGQNKDPEERKRSICSFFSPPPIHQPKLFDFSKKKLPANESRYGSNLKMSRGKLGSESTPSLTGSRLFSPTGQPQKQRYLGKNSFKNNLQTVRARASCDSQLQRYLSPSSLKTSRNLQILKSISEKESGKSSREVSLENVDESKEGVPQGYISLRKSFKEGMANSDIKMNKVKSKFKRQNRSSHRQNKMAASYNF